MVGCLDPDLWACEALATLMWLVQYQFPIWLQLSHDLPFRLNIWSRLYLSPIVLICGRVISVGDRAAFSPPKVLPPAPPPKAAV